MAQTTEAQPAERARMVDDIRRRYEAAGLRWHGNVVWAASPRQGRVITAELARRHARRRDRFTGVAGYVLRAARAVWIGVFHIGLSVAAFCGGLTLLLLLLLTGETAVVYQPGLPDPEPGGWIGGVIGGLLVTPVLVWVGDENDWHEIGTVTHVVFAPVIGLFSGLFTCLYAIPLALIGVVAGEVLSSDGSGPPTAAWIMLRLGWIMVPVIVAGTIGGIVRLWLIYPPGPLRFRDPVHRRLARALPETRDRDDFVQVDRAVERAVDWSDPRGPGRYVVGRFTYWADDVPGTWSGWWWPHTGFVVVTEPPVTLRVEHAGSAVPGRPAVWRLHSPDEPAAEWSDGFRFHASHGAVDPEIRSEAG
jgi:hypothetical protein